MGAAPPGMRNPGLGSDSQFLLPTSAIGQAGNCRKRWECLYRGADPTDRIRLRARLVHSFARDVAFDPRFGDLGFPITGALGTAGPQLVGYRPMPHANRWQAFAAALCGRSASRPISRVL